MPFNYDKLKGRITEVFKNRNAFAEAMGWTARTTSLKLNNKAPWKQLEILMAVSVLKLSRDDIPEYFFTAQAQNIEHKKGK